jgi:serine/threonine-protein kinase
MAPEQFLDVPSTPAMDIFACGVVLFEALTRTLPFRSLRPERRRACRDPLEIPLRAAAINSSVPQHLDAFIARCLELDPAQRFTSAEQAIEELQRLPSG